jgi:hypothetical protein
MRAPREIGGLSFLYLKSRDGKRLLPFKRENVRDFGLYIISFSRKRREGGEK